MPVVENVAFNGKTVGQICGKHSRGSPAVDCPCVHLIASVRIPDRRKMCPVVIGAVFIFSEFESAARFLQQSPIGLVIKFGEVCDRVLKLGMLSVPRN